MPLPPFRPLHPSWPMVATLAFLGATLTSAMAGAWTVPVVALMLAVVSAIVSARTIRRWEARSRCDTSQ